MPVIFELVSLVSMKSDKQQTIKAMKLFNLVEMCKLGRRYWYCQSFGTLSKNSLLRKIHRKIGCNVSSDCGTILFKFSLSYKPKLIINCLVQTYLFTQLRGWYSNEKLWIIKETMQDKTLGFYCWKGVRFHVKSLLFTRGNPTLSPTPKSHTIPQNNLHCFQDLWLPGRSNIFYTWRIIQCSQDLWEYDCWELDNKRGTNCS